MTSTAKTAATEPRDRGLWSAALFVVVTGLAAVPLWLIQPATPEVAAALPAASAAPLLGALVVVVLNRRAGQPLPAALRLSRDWQLGRRMVIALLTGLAVVIGIVQLRTILGWDLMALSMELLPLPLGLIAVIVLLSVTAQEVGFRGVLQPALRERLGPGVTTLVVGLVWTAWTLPGVAVIGPIQIVLVAATCVALSAVITHLGSTLPAGQVAVAVGFRWVVGMGLLVAGDEEAGVIPAWVVVALVSVVVAAAAPIVPKLIRRISLGGPIV